MFKAAVTVTAYVIILVNMIHNVQTYYGSKSDDEGYYMLSLI